MDLHHTTDHDWNNLLQFAVKSCQNSSDFVLLPSKDLIKKKEVEDAFFNMINRVGNDSFENLRNVLTQNH